MWANRWVSMSTNLCRRTDTVVRQRRTMFTGSAAVSSAQILLIRDYQMTYFALINNDMYSHKSSADSIWPFNSAIFRASPIADSGH